MYEYATIRIGGQEFLVRDVSFTDAAAKVDPRPYKPEPIVMHFESTGGSFAEFERLLRPARERLRRDVIVNKTGRLHAAMAMMILGTRGARALCAGRYHGETKRRRAMRRLLRPPRAM